MNPLVLSAIMFLIDNVKPGDVATALDIAKAVGDVIFHEREVRCRFLDIGCSFDPKGLCTFGKGKVAKEEILACPYRKAV